MLARRPRLVCARVNRFTRLDCCPGCPPRARRSVGTGASGCALRRTPGQARLADHQSGSKTTCRCWWCSAAPPPAAARRPCRPELLPRLAHRGQRHGGGGGEVDVVVADDGDVVGHPQPLAVISCSTPSASRSLAQNTAVGRARRAARRSGAPASRPAGDGQRRGLDDRSSRAEPERRPRIPAARPVPVRHLPQPLGPPTKAIRRCPRSSRCAPPARRRARRRPPPSTGRAGSARRSTSTTGMPRARSRASAGVGVGHRRDQDALHPLLLQQVQIGGLLVPLVVAVAEDDGQARPRWPRPRRRGRRR